jgi:hypothetical protein
MRKRIYAFCGGVVLMYHVSATNNQEEFHAEKLRCSAACDSYVRRPCPCTRNKHTHAYPQSHAHAWVCIRACIAISICISIRTCTCIRTCICIRTRTCTRACTGMSSLVAGWASLQLRHALAGRRLITVRSSVTRGNGAIPRRPAPCKVKTRTT